METEHLPHGDCLYRQEKHVVNVIMFREVSFTYRDMEGAVGSRCSRSNVRGDSHCLCTPPARKAEHGIEHVVEVEMFKAFVDEFQG